MKKFWWIRVFSFKDHQGLSSFAGLGPGAGEGAFIHAVIPSFVPADDPAAGTKQLPLHDSDLKPPPDPVLVTAQDLAGTDLVVLKQLLFAA
jgi:hypothetical protein